MPGSALPPLSEWENFYLIIGPSAAALIGLMFVVVTLGAERRAALEDADAAFEAFGTPTIFHFGAVVLLAAVMATPRQSIASLSVCVFACAVSGLVYVIRILIKMRRQKVYAPVAVDWVWHVCLPFAAYGLLFMAVVILGRSPETSLYIVGGAALLLLFIGIHNAWDSAVWMTSKEGSTAGHGP